ncbi:MAG: GIY-YIG nuclease family protein [Candidatus Neomarinimicrobiota bacterium]|nr:MAG: GIY-YIG nuclease family protein [Candidatus Neomarinimicrobiota bacterium]
MFTVYIIQSKQGHVYIGQTNNLERRLKEHREGFSKWTKRGTEWKLLYKEEFLDRTSAMRRERYFKTGAGWRWIQERFKNIGS